MKIKTVRLKMVVEDVVDYDVNVDGPNDPRKAAIVAQQFLAGKPRENFIVLLLDSKINVVGIETVHIGTINASLVSPSDVYKAALISNAASVICAHNHPSGDVQPSVHDKRITINIISAGELLGIPCNDHIITGDNNYYSFRESIPELWEKGGKK